MKNNKIDLKCAAILWLALLACPVTMAQFTTAAGNVFLQTNGAVNIGTAAASASWLTVSGDLLGTGEVFRTNCPAGGTSEWRKLRGGVDVGHFFNQGNAFSIQQSVGGQTLWLRNATANGLRLIDDGNFTLNGYTGNPRRGYVSVGDASEMNVGTGIAIPWARIHLVNGQNSNIFQGYRPEFQNGVMMTGNNQQAYMGHLWYTSGVNHLGLQIANTGTLGANRQTIRFIHTTDPTTNGTGAASLHGMEFMRMYPQSYTEGYVGIGDFIAGADNPTERLDVRTGAVRIRDLSLGTTYQAPSSDYDKVVVVRSDGKLNWRSAAGIVAAGHCKWTLGTGTYPNVWTAVGATSGCPGDVSNVGIGTLGPTAKLHVVSASAGYAGAFDLSGTATGKRAGQFVTSGMGTVHYGVDAFASGALSTLYTEGNIGVSGIANANASGYLHYNRGARGEANVQLENEVKLNVAVDANTGVVDEAQVHNNFGVRSIAYSYANMSGVTTNNYGGYFDSYAPTMTNSYGIYALASGSTNNWAGYFVGDVETTGAFIPSDENLKTGIAEAPIDQVTNVLDQLSVHSYQYNTDAFPQMNLPQGEQVGFLAQELEALAPVLVKNSMQPAGLNDAGEQVSEAVEFKSVNMTGLIPYLVAGYQAQGARIAQLEEIVAACCASGGRMVPQGPAEQRQQLENGSLLLGNARDLIIQPNPFSEPPTVFYTLERAGRMQLVANSADGKQLRVLREATQEAGEYQLVWDTNALQPGMYYLTLLLDGEPVVKKAVKVGR